MLDVARIIIIVCRRIHVLYCLFNIKHCGSFLKCYDDKNAHLGYCFIFFVNYRVTLV